MRNASIGSALACVLALAGCHGPEALEPPADPYDGYGAYPTPPEATGEYIDERAASVLHASRPLPPISGGTLAVTHDGSQIVAADPDRDRILVVDVAAATSRTGDAVTELQLAMGSEPGRVAIDETNHLAHVVLRGTGEVASVGLGGRATLTRTPVCPAPRGIAFDATRSLVRVACRDGEIASFDPTGTQPASLLVTGLDDLRDLILRGDDLLVTRFRSAEIVQLDQNGIEVRRVTPTSSISPTSVRADGSPAEFQPSVAWRAIPMGDGVLVAHQRSSDGDLQLAPGAYYDTGVCSGSIVQSAATIFRGSGLERVDSPNIAGATLPVDIAVSPVTGEVAVVGAGVESTTFYPSVTRIDPASLDVNDTSGYGLGYGGCINSSYYYGYGPDQSQNAEHTPNAIAVAYLPDGRLVVQGRDPAVIRIDAPTDSTSTSDPYGYSYGPAVPTTSTVVSLGGGVAFDTGHAFYHGDAGHGTACASCHPEGGDDGRVWNFAGVGPRRTPTVPAGFLATAPFHWNGDLPDLSHLMGTVFTQRMGGPSMDAAHVAAVGEWLDTRPSEETRLVDAAAATRGARVFADAGCASCHSGAMLTNNQTVDVGTGGPFQVPSLVGVSRALPVMHTGCAHTLRDRFTDECGGSAHGAITQSDPRLDDLIAYLETL